MVMVVYLHVRRELDIIAEDNFLMADYHIIGVEGYVLAENALGAAAHAELCPIAHFEA